MQELTTAVIIPCLNEAASIGNVVKNFKKALPTATVYVYDNGSSDGTSVVAEEAGAIVKKEPLKGKGNVVRRMFSDISADIYVMVDGDDTYDASSAPEMVELLKSQNLDMVTAIRDAVASEDEDETLPPLHQLGNRLFNWIVQKLFGRGFSDIFSGYRVFSKRFIKSFPAISRGFEIETEISIHCLDLRLPCAEIKTKYKKRHEDSKSKLKTFRDGFKILGKILWLLKENRPLFLFSILGMFFLILGIIISVPVVLTYFETGFVPRIPTTVLVMGLITISMINFICGLILSAVSATRKEVKRMFYLLNSKD